MHRLSMRSHTRLCLASAGGCLRPVNDTTKMAIVSGQNSVASFRSRRAVISPATKSFMLAKNDSSRVTGLRQFSTYPNHTVVPMPSLSPTMETGSIANWMLKEGDKFEAGTAICEVETDKATVTYDATEEGYLAKILVGSGELKVGVPMMITVDDLADVAAFANYIYSDADAAADPAAPAAPAPAPPVTAHTPAAAVAAVAHPVSTPATAAISSTPTGSRIVASPLARKLLRDAGLPSTTLEGIKGSGPGGRVVSADVITAIAAGLPVATAPIVHSGVTVAVASSAAPVAHVAVHAAPIQTSQSSVYQDFELSDLAKSVAARQTAAKQQVPHYYLSVELNLSKLIALREELNGSKGSLTVMDFIVKASALAVTQVPDVNAAWMDKFVRRYEQVDINLVMGTGQGLLTPVIRDVGARGLKSISQEIGGFEDSLFTEGGVEIEASKMAVGTFSIHNLGMFGVKSASPIVLAPQACALALGAIIDTVVPKVDGKEGDDNWAVAPVMVATLSCDHRVVDGAVGAQWLSALKTLVENPNSMLL